MRNMDYYWDYESQALSAKEALETAGFTVSDLYTGTSGSKTYHGFTILAYSDEDDIGPITDYLGTNYRTASIVMSTEWYISG